MWLCCLDLESVLIPELWPILGKALGLPELNLTTRQVSDKLELNRIRLRALKRSGVTTAQIRKILSRVKPLPGAGAFLKEIWSRVPVVVVSDCFEELAAPLLKQLGSPLFIGHRWTQRKGRVVALRLRTTAKDTKAPVVRAFQKLGYRVFAVGDSLNDLGMLRAADASCLFRPSPRTRAAARDLKAFRRYAECLALAEKNFG